MFFIYYLFAFDTPLLKYQFRFVGHFIKIVGNFGIIFFVFRKASKGLKKDGKEANKRRMKLLNWTVALSIFINLIMMVYLEVKLFTLDKEFDDKIVTATTIITYETAVCQEPIWVINSLLFFMQVLLLYFQVRKVVQSIQENDGMYRTSI